MQYFTTKDIFSIIKKMHLTFRFTKKIAIILAVIFIGLPLVGGGVYYFKKTKNKIISVDGAAKTAIDFINQNILPAEGDKAVLITANAEEGLYKFIFKIGANQYTSYITKSGKYLFPQGIDLTAPIENKNQK